MSVPAATKKPKPSKPKVAPTHPPVSDMVRSAIAATGGHKGVSLQNIKKYIAANYKVDVEKLAPHIRRQVAKGAESGTLVRVGNKGKGASGSFKLASKKAEPKIKAKTTPKKPSKPSTKPKKASAPKPKTAKKPTKPKAKAASKPKAPKPAKKAATPKKPKTPKKTLAKKATPKKK